MNGNEFYIGLDLGQRQDYTAVAVVERVAVPVGGIDYVTYEQRREQRLHVRHLERVRLGTSYVDVVERVAAMVQSAALAGNCTLVVDGTGVGGAVVDLLKAARLGCSVVAVSITGGENATSAGEQWRVPKRVLITALETALARKELRIARGLKDAGALVDELLRMRVTISEGSREKYGARSGGHDDLVLATALAVWRAKRGDKGVWGTKSLGLE
jgi:hypothetical protein